MRYVSFLHVLRRFYDDLRYRLRRLQLSFQYRLRRRPELSPVEIENMIPRTKPVMIREVDPKPY